MAAGAMLTSDISASVGAHERAGRKEQEEEGRIRQEESAICTLYTGHAHSPELSVPPEVV